MPTGGYMWICMYLRLDHAIAKVQDRGYPAGEAPKLLFSIPVAARGLEHGVQGLLVGLGLDEDHFRSPRPYGLAAHEELDRCVANLAFSIGPMTNADQGVAVATGQLDGATVSWSQGLDDAMSAAFCLHRQWRPNTVDCEA
jgi:hypothetical protein